ncbi:hypothetical protein ACJX0J_039175 [Zea mays]
MNQFSAPISPRSFLTEDLVHHRKYGLTNIAQRSAHGLRPQFAQLYIYDTEHEVQNRLGISLAVVCMWCQERAENANIPFGGKPIVYPDLLERYMDPAYLATRAICIIDSDLYITNIFLLNDIGLTLPGIVMLWEFLDPQDDSRLLHTDLVLLDEEFLRHTCPGLSSVMPTAQGIQSEWFTALDALNSSTEIHNYPADVRDANIAGAIALMLALVNRATNETNGLQLPKKEYSEYVSFMPSNLPRLDEDTGDDDCFWT